MKPEERDLFKKNRNKLIQALFSNGFSAMQISFITELPKREVKLFLTQDQMTEPASKTFQDANKMKEALCAEMVRDLRQTMTSDDVEKVYQKYGLYSIPNIDFFIQDLAAFRAFNHLEFDTEEIKTYQEQAKEDILLLHNPKTFSADENVQANIDIARDLQMPLFHTRAYSAYKQQELADSIEQAEKLLQDNKLRALCVLYALGYTEKDLSVLAENIIHPIEIDIRKEFIYAYGKEIKETRAYANEAAYEALKELGLRPLHIADLMGADPSDVQKYFKHGHKSIQKNEHANAYSPTFGYSGDEAQRKQCVILYKEGHTQTEIAHILGFPDYHYVSNAIKQYYSEHPDEKEWNLNNTRNTGKAGKVYTELLKDTVINYVKTHKGASQKEIFEYVADTIGTGQYANMTINNKISRIMDKYGVSNTPPKQDGPLFMKKIDENTKKLAEAVIYSGQHHELRNGKQIAKEFNIDPMTVSYLKRKYANAIICGKKIDDLVAAKDRLSNMSEESQKQIILGTHITSTDHLEERVAYVDAIDHSL